MQYLTKSIMPVSSIGSSKALAIVLGQRGKSPKPFVDPGDLTIG